MQPGKSSNPGWVLVGEKAGRVGLLSLHQTTGWGHLSPQPGSPPESNGQRFPFHTGFSLLGVLYDRWC